MPNDPMAPDSYIPDQEQMDIPSAPQQLPQPSQTPEDVDYAKRFEDVVKGRASDVNDLDLTIAGIYAGDPIGMETFDLGFYDDGHPAIIINGAPVPIPMDQWAALANMRQKTRDDVAQRIRFNDAKRTAEDSVMKVVRAMPNLPAGLGDLLMATAGIDPQFAMQQLSNLYVNNKKDGNRSQIGELSGVILKRNIDNTLGWMNQRGGKKQVALNPNLPNQLTEVDVPSPIEQRRQALMNEGTPEANITAYALSEIGNMLPSPEMKQMTGGGRQSAFGRMAQQGNDIAEGGSFYSRLQHLAAYSGMFNETIPRMSIPPIEDPTDPRIKQLRTYLRSLDMWAVRYLHFDPSTDEEINLQLSSILGAKGVSEQNYDPTLPNFNPLLDENRSDPANRRSGTTSTKTPEVPATSAADRYGSI